MQYFGARLRAYDTDVIQLFKALADFTQPIELQKTLPMPSALFTALVMLPAAAKNQAI